MKCRFCDLEVHPKGIGSHMRVHKQETEDERRMQERPKIPPWRSRQGTPVFTDGQAGVKIPRNKINRGWK